MLHLGLVQKGWSYKNVASAKKWIFCNNISILLCRCILIFHQIITINSTLFFVNSVTKILKWRFASFFKLWKLFMCFFNGRTMTYSRESGVLLWGRILSSLILTSKSWVSTKMLCLFTVDFFFQLNFCWFYSDVIASNAYFFISSDRPWVFNNMLLSSTFSATH